MDLARKGIKYEFESYDQAKVEGIEGRFFNPFSSKGKSRN